MDRLVLLDHEKIQNLISKRKGEIKFGENIKLLASITNIYESIKNLDVKYVVFGLPEDIGVFSNLGKTGTVGAWEATIKILLNTQNNQFTHANDVLILGHLNFSEELSILSNFDQNNDKDLQKAGKLTEIIDKNVSELVHTIVKAGKTPIIIGGGHNNAYGNIKGTSLALNKSINAINFDAHTDFRALEGRHSGNGFSYAAYEGFLDKYFVFGLHENYTSQEILDTFHSKKSLTYNTYEAIEVRKELKFKDEMQRALKHISKKPFGIEIDCDAIKNIPSSARTPSGFSVKRTRSFLNFFASHKKASYLHICEAAPTPETETQVGKLITYLITDFIRANGN